MNYILHHPLFVFLVIFLGLWLAAWLGAVLRRQSKFDDDARYDFGLILAATLTLLGLLIGFSFSMAASRYDQRKNLEEGEANAIGTEYLRADLLPAAARTRLRDLLRKYVELRVRYYTADDDEMGQIDSQTAKLQGELWSTVVAITADRPNPVMALAASGMNDVINAQGYTQAAWWNRVPLSAGILLAIIAVCCNLMVGYGSRSASPGSRLFVILPFFVALAVSLINDIDTPRHGLIHVAPRNLNALLDSMTSQ